MNAPKIHKFIVLGIRDKKSFPLTGKMGYWAALARKEEIEKVLKGEGITPKLKLLRME